MGRRGALGQPPLSGERGGRKWSHDARYTTLLLRPRDWGNCSFIEVLGTAGCWASGGTKTKRNKGFSTRPSSGGGSGAVTISRRAVPSTSGSPVSGPLALALAAGSGGGLDGLGVLSVTGSTTPHGGRLLPRRGSGGGHRGAPTATSRLRGCSRSGSSSGFPTDPTTPEGGNAAESSSPEREGSPSDAATDIWSSGEAPKETGGVPHSAEAPVRTNGTPAGCGVPEGWEPPLGEALTVILRSPLTPPDAVPPSFVPGRTPDHGRGRGTPPCLTQRSLLRNSEMVMSPQEEHEPSTKASSACWTPRHVRQWSWPSWGARDRPHPETHGW